MWGKIFTQKGLNLSEQANSKYFENSNIMNEKSAYVRILRKKI